MIAEGFAKRISESLFQGNNKELRMKWMTKTSMILALAFFALAGLATVEPNRAVAAQDGVISPTGKLAEIKSIGVTGEGASTELVIVLS